LEAKSARSSARVSLPGTEFAEEEGLELWRMWEFKRKRPKKIVRCVLFNVVS